MSNKKFSWTEWKKATKDTMEFYMSQDEAMAIINDRDEKGKTSFCNGIKQNMGVTFYRPLTVVWSLDVRQGIQLNLSFSARYSSFSPVCHSSIQSPVTSFIDLSLLSVFSPPTLISKSNSNWSQSINSSSAWATNEVRKRSSAASRITTSQETKLRRWRQCLLLDNI